MSDHDMYPLDHKDEDDFFDEIDDQNHGGGVGDAALDEYEMVCFFLFLFLFRFAFLYLFFELFYVFMYVFIELGENWVFDVFGDWNSLLR